MVVRSQSSGFNAVLNLEEVGLSTDLFHPAGTVCSRTNGFGCNFVSKNNEDMERSYGVKRVFGSCNRVVFFILFSRHTQSAATSRNKIA